MPLQQVAQAITFYGQFYASGVGATGLTVTFDVTKRDGTVVVSGASATEHNATYNPGVYRYTLVGGSVDEASEYVGHFHAASGADVEDVPAAWVVGPAWVENVDDAVSDAVAAPAAALTSYAPAVAGDAMALTSGERSTLTAAVWAEATRTLTSFGTLAADAATAVWAAGTRTLTSFGTLVADAAAAVWAAGTRTLTAATNLVLAKGTGITGFNDLSASEVEDAVWDATAADHTTPGTTGRSLDTAGSGGVDVEALADAIWDEVSAGHVTSGTMGALIAAMYAKVAALDPDAYVVRSPVIEAGVLTLVQGDKRDGVEFDFTSAADLTGATVTFYAKGVSIVGSVTVAGGATQTVEFDFSAANTNAMLAGGQAFMIRAVLADTQIHTLMVGRLEVTRAVA